jgi:hypothetical protein
VRSVSFVRLQFLLLEYSELVTILNLPVPWGNGMSPGALALLAAPFAARGSSEATFAALSLPGLSEWTATALRPASASAFCLRPERQEQSTRRREINHGEADCDCVRSSRQHLIPCTRSGARLRLSTWDWELGYAYATPPGSSAIGSPARTSASRPVRRRPRPPTSTEME